MVGFPHLLKHLQEGIIASRYIIPIQYNIYILMNISDPYLIISNYQKLRVFSDPWPRVIAS